MKKRVIAVIQARMGSTRLPGKVLKKIMGKTIIEIIFERLKFSRQIDAIVLSTSTNRENDVLVGHAEDIGLKFYRGSEDDLVSRLLETAREYGADAFVRITADCPFVCPSLVDRLVSIYRKNPERFDYLSNFFHYTFPVGMELEIFPAKVFETLNVEIEESFFRENFVTYVHKRPQEFRIYNLKFRKNLSLVRLTLDYREDFLLISKMQKALYKKGNIFDLREIISFLEKRPELLAINEIRINKTEISSKENGACHELYGKGE